MAIAPTAVVQSIGIIKQDAVQLDRNPFEFAGWSCEWGKTLVLFHSTNLAVSARTILHDEFVAYTTFAPQAMGTVNGLPIGHDRGIDRACQDTRSNLSLPLATRASPSSSRPVGP